MPASNMRIKDYREYIINAIFMAPIWHTCSVLGMIRLMHTVIKKNDIAHYFTTRPLPTKLRAAWWQRLRLKGTVYGLNILRQVA